MDRIEDIGPVLGILAFVGLAALVLLLIQQAREVRRLREWAGRAPERAILIAEREAEERGVVERSRLAGLRAWAERSYESIDRVSPVDPRFGIAFVAVVAVGLVLVLGVLGGGEDDAGPAGEGPQIERSDVRVAVLNGTATPTSPAVPGLAAKVANKVRRQGYKLGAVADSESVAVSVAMFRGGRREEAEQLAADVRKILGPVAAERMTDAFAGSAQGADVALVIGADDSRL
jgi:hypothetical protein